MSLYLKVHLAIVCSVTIALYVIVVTFIVTIPMKWK